jgi:hypothetical protein
MKLELEVKTKEKAEELIKQLQEFVEENTLYPNIKKGVYYYIDHMGNFRMGDKKDTGTEDLANIYATQEIAEKALAFKKNRKVWNFIENWAMHNSTFEPDWEDGEQVKYYVWYDSETFIWDMYYTYTTNVGIVYMSKEECEKLEEILNSSDKYKL